ncbi:MAG: hypothetical protein KI790_06205 [Cyclobacteriaceae bacterium]|nr:hypothetical protein [Cyclobacteriaceae bacterium HetDA_MAG_MS6]
MNRSRLWLLVLVALMWSCGGSKYQKSPLDTMIRDMPTNDKFSIILYDMNVDGNFIETFQHQYRVIKEDQSGEIDEFTTGWLEVSEQEFNKHVNDMGMEIAARDSTGKLTKAAAPPGYHNYVGNEKYGRWENRGGSSFWAFYGQYAFMSSMFNMMAYPARRSYYNDWRGGYYRTGRSYYGPKTGGRSYYGTNSSFGRSTNPSSSWSRNRSLFKQRVSSRTSRSSSSGGFRSRGGSFGK